MSTWKSRTPMLPSRHTGRQSVSVFRLGPDGSLSAMSTHLSHAAEVNRKDYRAWYGLGQAYELLSMHQYALYYYQHATALRYVCRSLQLSSVTDRDHAPRSGVFFCAATTLLSPTTSRLRSLSLDAPYDPPIGRMMSGFGRRRECVTRRWAGRFHPDL